MTEQELYHNAIETIAIAVIADCHSKEDMKLLVSMLGLEQKSGDELEKLVDDIIETNPDKVAEYKSGKTKLIGYFVGMVMKTNKTANPAELNKIFTEKLK